MRYGVLPEDPWKEEMAKEEEKKTGLQELLEGRVRQLAVAQELHQLAKEADVLAERCRALSRALLGLEVPKDGM